MLIVESKNPNTPILIVLCLLILFLIVAILFFAYKEKKHPPGPTPPSPSVECIPLNQIYTDDYLEFLHATTVCKANGDFDYSLDCGVQFKEHYKKIKWSKAESNITIKKYPKQILDEKEKKTCKTDFPFEFVIKTNAKPIQLRYTEIMPEKHLYNLKTQKFICDEDNLNKKYQYLYDSANVEPAFYNFNLKDYFLEPAIPCSPIIKMENSKLYSILEKTKKYLPDNVDLKNNLKTLPENSTPILYYIKYSPDKFSEEEKLQIFATPLWPSYNEGIKKYSTGYWDENESKFKFKESYKSPSLFDITNITSVNLSAFYLKHRFVDLNFVSDDMQYTLMFTINPIDSKIDFLQI